ncbi:uncharacterized protein [Nicotiana tomentosiformis]|uniref:uncharacterized protein n=1 Tax=Nicotiana tomentosiformis TaxID=4098 RepID=UPI00388C9907
MPSFKGTRDSDLYLDWERKVEVIFDCHNYSEGKKVKLDVVEFSNYASIWWKKLTRDRQQDGEPPIATWTEMKSHEEEILKQGTMTVDEYFKAMDMAMIQDNCMEKEEATMARFLNDLNREIANVVEIQQYVTIDEVVRRTINGEYEGEKSEEEEEEESVSEDDLELPFNDALVGVVRRIMTINLGINSEEQRENIFHTRCGINEKTFIIIDSGSCANVVSSHLANMLALTCMKHPKPYRLQWLNDSGELKVNKQCMISFNVCRNIIHDERKNKYYLELNGKKYTLAPLSPSQVFEDQKRLREIMEKQRAGKRSELEGKEKK